MTMVIVKILAYVAVLVSICGSIAFLVACLGILSAAKTQRENDAEFDDSAREVDE